MSYYIKTITEEAEEAFRVWLRDVLSDDVSVTEVASPLLWLQDWDASTTVAVPSAKTKTGQPEFFCFDPISDFVADIGMRLT